MRNLALVLAPVLVVVATASAQQVQLDISSGFNMDVLCGALEFQAIMNYADLYDPNQSLSDLQGREAEGVAWSTYSFPRELQRIVAIDDATAEVLGAPQWLPIDGGTGEYFGYAIATSGWTRPGHKNDSEALPIDGVISGAAYTYHIASHAGNATLPGDWTEVPNPTAGEGGVVVTGAGMAVQFNAMHVQSYHSTVTFQIASTTATLPVAQQGSYASINFVLAGVASTPDSETTAADGARNMQIVAIYSDASEDILYSFSTENELVGPVSIDSFNVSAIYNPADFNVVDQYSEVYSNIHWADDLTGNITYGPNEPQYAGSLFEFAEALPLDAGRTLVGIRLEDADPSLNWSGRGLTVFGASAVAAVAGQPSIEVLTEGDLDWVYQNTAGTLSLNGHKVALTVNVLNLNGNASVAVTVQKKPASGPGEVTAEDTGDPLVKQIVGSLRSDGIAGCGALTLEVTATGDVAGQTVLDVLFTCRRLGDIDGNGGAEPGDVQLLINELNGLPNPAGHHDKAFDLDANGGPEPGDVQFLMNILNGLPVP